MKLRTRLNLVVAGLTAVFVLVLAAEEIHSARNTVREEMEAASQVASRLLGQFANVYSRTGNTKGVLQFLRQLGHIRANDIVLRGPTGQVLYHSPPATYQAGRNAPAWFAPLLAPKAARHAFRLPDGTELTIEAQASRAILEAWERVAWLLALAVIMLVLVNGLAFWLVDRALAPFPIIVNGLERIKHGELAFRLPSLPGAEALAIGAAFNRMAQAVEDNVQAERKAREAETRLEERREMALVVEQRIEEERRLIAHELHDEFGQSVTAIRSLAQAILGQTGEPAVRDAARLISEEAARLYDAMHGLIPRLVPVSLDELGLAETLENLVRDWQRRHPSTVLSLRHELPADLGPSVTLAAYRVVQEGLINALRHARASHVDIDLRSTRQRMSILVADDGVGLEPDWPRSGHFGLRGLAERVERLGGAFSVRNRKPCGVCLNADIPLGVGA
ncbi:MAG: histidine kinase [Steroidobacteraceae bacterium]